MPAGALGRATFRLLLRTHHILNENVHVDAAQTRRLLDLLFYRFESEGTSLFAVLDGARDPLVLNILTSSGAEHDCLFSGRLDPALRTAAPYLVRLLPGSALCESLIEQGWGRAWGLYVAARGDLHQVRRHLRSFLRVETEDRKKLFFRYYDPRVLRAFLPTCDATQLRQIFGPIERFDMEAPDSTNLLRFRLIPEPIASATLRSWTYSLSGSEAAQDDRGGRLAPTQSSG